MDTVKNAVLARTADILTTADWNVITSGKQEMFSSHSIPFRDGLIQRGHNLFYLTCEAQQSLVITIIRVHIFRFHILVRDTCPGPLRRLRASPSLSSHKS